MGFLGSTRGLTPALDAFARESVVFTNAFAQAPITTVSHATMLTGTYPPFHHVTDFGTPLGASIPFLRSSSFIHGPAALTTSPNRDSPLMIHSSPSRSI